MKYLEFTKIVSEPRMDRYLQAANYNTRKARTLYKFNQRLSQEIFIVIGYFEVALRNAIDRHYTHIHGSNWLNNFIEEHGIFKDTKCAPALKIIAKAQNKHSATATHSKVLSSLEFGFWRYLFSQPQFNAAGKSLLRIFPHKPLSNSTTQYNHTYVFNKLAVINRLRNRIAHHEPICFQSRSYLISTAEVQETYVLLLELFQWLGIAHKPLLYGLDHVKSLSEEIEVLQNA